MYRPGLVTFYCMTSSFLRKTNISPNLGEHVPIKIIPRRTFWSRNEEGTGCHQLFAAAPTSLDRHGWSCVLFSILGVETLHPAHHLTVLLLYGHSLLLFWKEREKRGDRTKSNRKTSTHMCAYTTTLPTDPWAPKCPLNLIQGSSTSLPSFLDGLLSSLSEGMSLTPLSLGFLL